MLDPYSENNSIQGKSSKIIFIVKYLIHNSIRDRNCYLFFNYRNIFQTKVKYVDDDISLRTHFLKKYMNI